MLVYVLSNVIYVSRMPLQCVDMIAPDAGHVVEVTSETITVPMICTLIQHDFLPVFFNRGKMMLYSNKGRFLPVKVCLIKVSN